MSFHDIILMGGIVLKKVGDGINQNRKNKYSW